MTQQQGNPLGWGLFFILAPVLIQAATQILFKSAALRLESFTFLNIITNVFYLTCLMLYVVRTVLWQQALKRYPLSFVYPFISLSYVSLLLASAFIFKEPISTWNLVGSAIIIVGVITIYRSQEDNSTSVGNASETQ